MSKLKELNTPIFWAEGHPGELDAATWQVEVTGLVKEPRTFSYADLLALPKTVVNARLTSVTRWSVFGAWGGVHFRDLLDVVGVDPKAAYVEFFSYRKIYTTAIPLEVALRERTLLAYEFEGEPLEEDYGGPVRNFCPYLWGYKSAKSVVRVQLLDRPSRGYWEVRGYPDAAQILAGRMLDINTRRWRQIPDGEVIKFLDDV
ncbi:MAG: molybdopterin-dependent oxidoreductase [Anaerolineae bacterium]|nr:molybdopterin-dependent oxidoreductase [Anaerolineae bacterium]